MEAIKGGSRWEEDSVLCAVCGVMKAGVCIIDIPLVMAKVPTLYHFYGMILLGCHPLVQRRIQLSNARAEGSHTFTLSLSPRISVAIAPSLLSHPVISPFFSPPCLALLWFSSRSPFIHFSIHACALAGYGWCGKNTQTHSHSWAHSKKACEDKHTVCFPYTSSQRLLLIRCLWRPKNSPHPSEYSQFSHAGNANAMYIPTNFTFDIFYSIYFYVYLSIFFLFRF